LVAANKFKEPEIVPYLMWLSVAWSVRQRIVNSVGVPFCKYGPLRRVAPKLSKVTKDKKKTRKKRGAKQKNLGCLFIVARTFPFDTSNHEIIEKLRCI
jgi:hypothetical protein